VGRPSPFLDIRVNHINKRFAQSLLICIATITNSAWNGSRSRHAALVSTRRSFRVPRYYFHVRRGQLTVVDREGMELSDEVEAIKEAARRGRQLSPDERGAIIVEDEWDYRIVELPLDID